MWNRFIFGLGVLLFIGLAGSSQEDHSKKIRQNKPSYLTDTCRWNIEIPIWIPGFRGEFAYGDIKLDGEDGTKPDPEQPIEKPGIGDAFKRLFKTRGYINYFFVSGLSYENDRWFGEMDVFSGTVGGKIMFRYNNQSLVKASFHSDLLRITGGYSFYQKELFEGKGLYKLSGTVGLRGHYFRVWSQLENRGEKIRVDPLWVEPLLGLKNELKLTYWKFIVQGDMGSFGLNDRLSYMLNLNAQFRMNKLLSLKMGWNSWYVVYSDKFKNEDLKLKMYLAGPVTALVFNF